jgi:hypothetical protein
VLIEDMEIYFGDDQRDVVLVAKLRGVVDDDASRRRGLWRVLARDLGAGGEKTDLRPGEVEAGELVDREVPPLKLTDRPSERLLASAKTSPTGKSRSARTSSRVSPTSPVAPTTATL